MIDQGTRGRLTGALVALGVVAGALGMLFGGCTLDRGGTQQQECTADVECPVADANCQLPLCDGGFCETDPKPDGPVTQQAVGDCAVVSCEAGETVRFPDPADKPADGPCATYTCDGAELSASYAAEGAPCALGSATGTCDGQGTCIITCEFDNECPPHPSNPCQSPYCDTAAGICAFESLPDGPSVNDVPGDCRLNLCEGGREFTESLPLNQACSVDGGDVCDGFGACKVSGGQPCTTGAECLSGFCPADDGVCCDAACDSLCEACTLGDNGIGDGICAPVTTGTDPKGECADGACDGALGCGLELGQPCATGADCLSGHCPEDDLVCCNLACSGLCASCKQSDTGMMDGTCAAVTEGSDPKGECSDALCNTGECSGTIGACEPRPAGTVCRIAQGDCDVDDQCDGTSVGCPDLKAPSNTVCRGPAGDCDEPELCDGMTNACPSDSVKASGTLCRMAAGDCDEAELCDGTNAACPSDVKKAGGTVCRMAAGDCDEAELCDGTSDDCPSDAKKAGGTVCRMAAGDCDEAELCDGTSDACPSDAKKPSSFECREADGACDEAEFCSGGDDCPADGVKAAGEPGDPSCGFYLCDGTSASCPTTCGGNTACTGGATCDSASCCLPSGVSCQGSASNCCSGNCTMGGNGNCT